MELVFDYMGTVTLRQVAELTGKSEATVSLVLNSRQFHRVSPRTRAMIQRVAAELGYVPNMQAQAAGIGARQNPQHRDYCGQHDPILQ